MVKRRNQVHVLTLAVCTTAATLLASGCHLFGSGSFDHSYETSRDLTKVKRSSRVVPSILSADCERSVREMSHNCAVAYDEVRRDKYDCLVSSAIFKGVEVTAAAASTVSTAASGLVKSEDARRHWLYGTAVSAVILTMAFAYDGYLNCVPRAKEDQHVYEDHITHLQNAAHLIECARAEERARGWAFCGSYEESQDGGVAQDGGVSTGAVGLDAGIKAQNIDLVSSSAFEAIDGGTVVNFIPPVSCRHLLPDGTWQYQSARVLRELAHRELQACVPDAFVDFGNIGAPK